MFEAWLAQRLQGSAHHGYSHLIVTEYSLDRFLAGHLGIWHTASFRCAAEFGRHRGIADVDQTAPTKLDS
jgi:hypothetical protein